MDAERPPRCPPVRRPRLCTHVSRIEAAVRSEEGDATAIVHTHRRLRLRRPQQRPAPHRRAVAARGAEVHRCRCSPRSAPSTVSRWTAALSASGNEGAPGADAAGRRRARAGARDWRLQPVAQRVAPRSGSSQILCLTTTHSRGAMLRTTGVMICSPRSQQRRFRGTEGGEQASPPAPAATARTASGRPTRWWRTPSNSSPPAPSGNCVVIGGVDEDGVQRCGR